MTWSAERVYENPKAGPDGTIRPGKHEDVGLAIWNTDEHKVVYLESTDGTFRARMVNGRFGMLRTYAEARAKKEKK